MALGAFILGLGVAMIVASPVILSFGTLGGGFEILWFNVNTAQQLVSLCLQLLFLGLILIPVGASILAYGTGARESEWTSEPPELTEESN